MKKLLRILLVVLFHGGAVLACAAALVTLTAMPGHVCGPDAEAGFASVGRFIFFTVTMVIWLRLAKAIWRLPAAPQEPLP